MNPSQLPSWFVRFFEWFCRPELFEELQGDLEEAFEENKVSVGARRAQNIYRMEVLKMLRPSVIRFGQSHSKFNHFVMFKNYYKTSIRSLLKNPLTSFINIFGLSVAIGASVYVYAFAQWTFRTDQFHENKHEVYLTTFFADRDGTVQQNGKTPWPLGQMLKTDFTQIKRVCRIDNRRVILKHGDNVFHERVRFADATFLRMFTFPLKWGRPESLTDLNSIILSEKMSTKYFGDENPIGKQVLVKLGQDRSKTFKVTGVAKPFPKSRTIDFDFLVNFENLEAYDVAHDFDDWNEFVDATLIQVEEPMDLAAIESGMEKYRLLQNETQSDWKISSFAFEELAMLHKKGSSIRNNISWGSENDYTSIVFLVVVAVFLLALACFNYINIAIVSAARRLKEIGIRKTIGANRRILIVQFLAENMLVASFALLLGLLLGATVFIPWFEQLIGFDMDFRFNDQYLWVFLPVILLITGLASGIYPAFYISRFPVTGILKGSVQFGKKNPLTKVFLGFQLILACMLITSAVMFTQNSRYMAERSWGYVYEGVLYAQVDDRANFEQLYDAMAQETHVLSIAGSTHHLGRSSKTTIVERPDRSYEVDELAVGPEYFATLGIRLAAGRTFKAHHESDKYALVVNEQLVEKLGLTEPLGQVLKIDSNRYEVIGVVKDFHNYDFFNQVEPTIFKVSDREDYRFLSAKVRAGYENEAYVTLRSHWSNTFPEIPFRGGHQEDVWGFYFEEISVHGKVWRGIASIAVLLASLGLYGLVTLNVSGRIREFSIRKVLGAHRLNIAINILRQYALLFGVALLVGVPVSYYLLDFVLDFAYTYRRPMNFWGVGIAAFFLVFVLVGVVTIQVGKVSKRNPADGLRVE